MNKGSERADARETGAATKETAARIHRVVRERYAAAVRQRGGSCCAPRSGDQAMPGSQSCSCSPAAPAAERIGYSTDELQGVPESAPSFGCGNPIALSRIGEGETVLDLGSGAGLDLILAARKVGSTGKVIGLDMTPEMVETARENLRRSGIGNAEVRLGLLERMPVADAEVDWIISNCVINLSPDKRQVFAEAYRVLKPGGQLLVSDLLAEHVPPEIRGNPEAWAGCIAGAIAEGEFLGLLREAGFVDVAVLTRAGFELDSGAAAQESRSDALRLTSASIFARKPQGAARR